MADLLVEAGVITRILALVEVSYSNSIIEAYWRSLQREWLVPSRARARPDRLAANRALPCSTCEPESPAKSAALQLRAANP